MAMWSGKTDLWGRKTRPSNIQDTANGHDKKEEEYLEIEDKIKALEAKLEFYKSMLNEKCTELASLNKRLDSNTTFMQTVVLELIQMKNFKPSAPVTTATAPAGALEKYIAKKNSEAVKSS